MEFSNRSSSLFTLVPAARIDKPNPPPYILQAASDKGTREPDETSDVDSVELVLEAEHFARALDTCISTSGNSKDRREDIFKLVETYHAFAVERAKILQQSDRSVAHVARRRLDDVSSQDSMDLDDTDETQASSRSTSRLRHWQREAETWDLLRRLLPLRYPGPELAKTDDQDPTTSMTGNHLWKEFIQGDPVAKERKSILEWLQTNADRAGADINELVRDLQQNAERGDIIAHGWLHTRSAIKMQKNVNGWSHALDPNATDVSSTLLNEQMAEPMVTQLDPDVVTRQSRKLQPQDLYFERAIWLGCYELLRRGRSAKDIRDWCVERTEVWRAVSMSAVLMSKAGSESGAECNAQSSILWRRACFAAARQGGSDDYERAVYGILSGDIPTVERVCKTWDDFMFAHYNGLLRTQFDAYLLKKCSPDVSASVAQAFPSFNAIQFHGDAETVAERLVKSLETNPKTATEAVTPEKALQSAILSGTLDQFILEQGESFAAKPSDHGSAGSAISSSTPPRAVVPRKYFQISDKANLRLLAHVHIVLSALEALEHYPPSESDELKAKERVLAAYVNFLRVNELEMLIPLYCSKLQADRSLYVLSRNLSQVEDRDQRLMLLKIMSKLDIDIANFIAFQPKSLLEEFPDVDRAYPAKGKFNIFMDSPATLKYGRPLEPDFFGEVPEELDPFDEQLIRSMEWTLLVDGLWTETFSTGVAIYKRFLKHLNLHAAKEFAARVPCADIFRQKLGYPVDDDSDTTWFKDFENDEDGGVERQIMAAEAKNFFEMECLIRCLDSMETVASMAGLSRDGPSAQEREFWSDVGNEVKSIKSFMKPLLNNWLLEQTHYDDEFDILRETYLPETILGFISVLHFAGTSLSRDNLLECMDLAALIAEKDSDVAAVFMKCERMKELVEGFASCSKALAVSATDKRTTGTSSKKLREMGWSRELWSVKQ